MPVIDGNAGLQEMLVEAAKWAVVAAKKAPQVTGKVNIKSHIITGEDLWPFVEIMGILGETVTFIRGDYVTMKMSLEKGNPQALLVLGADLHQSEMNWNCGACGFKTCAEFNRHSKENFGPGGSQAGPSCVWKVLDFGCAADWAAAQLWAMNIDNRVQASTGLTSNMLGYLEGCSGFIGISLGPCGDQVFYDRPLNARTWTMDDFEKSMRQTLPQHFVGFAGSGKPPFKFDQRFAEDSYYVQVAKDPEFDAASAEMGKKLSAAIEKYRALREKEKAAR